MKYKPGWTGHPIHKENEKYCYPILPAIEFYEEEKPAVPNSTQMTATTQVYKGKKFKLSKCFSIIELESAKDPNYFVHRMMEMRVELTKKATH